MQNPNFLLIMADQLTPFMTGFYGNAQVKTPNLDKLCARSIRFDEAYTPYPLCAPARASMMTGKYAYDLNCYDNSTPFASDQPTFAHYLTRQGYETVLTGKMHFVGPDQLHGLHKRLTTDIYPADLSWMPKFIDEANHVMQHPGNAAAYMPNRLGPMEWNQFIGYDEETHFRALEYLNDQKGAERPFFLCCSYHHPHDPFNPPAKYLDMYKDADMDIPLINEETVAMYTTLDKWLNNGFHRNDINDITDPENLLKLRRCYAALVTYIDDKVGELLTTLEHTGLDKNTVIMFTSDHGDLLGERGMVQKRCFYEWAAKIPMLLTLPNGEHAGTQCKTPVSLIDILPTLRHLAGEENYCVNSDGISLLDALKGQEERAIFAEGHGEGVLAPVFMARYKQYKCIYHHGYEHETQLFDLSADPWERKNLYHDAQFKDIGQMLKYKILARFCPERVQQQLDTGIADRRVINEAMQLSGTNWDYTPDFPGSQRYVR